MSSILTKLRRPMPTAHRKEESMQAAALRKKHLFSISQREEAGNPRAPSARLRWQVAETMLLWCSRKADQDKSARAGGQGGDCYLILSIDELQGRKTIREKEVKSCTISSWVTFILMELYIRTHFLSPLYNCVSSCSLKPSFAIGFNRRWTAFVHR